MSLKDANPRLEVPKGLPEKTSVWSSAKVSDPRAVPILERFSRDISAKRLTGGMIVKEFLAQRLVPLHAHSRPMWDYQLGDNKLRLRSQDLPIGELNKVVVTLMGSDPGDMPEALGPLYRLDDRVDLIAVLPVFDERGLFPVEGPGPVEVSSDNTFGGEDSEKTVDDCLTRAPPLSHVVLLCEVEDDDVTGQVSAVISSRLTRISREPTSAPRATRSTCVLTPWRHVAESSGSPPWVGGPVAPELAAAESKRRWVDVEE
ncbi:hypothetical protein D1007_27037 [Hordeum vulgare]|nr:hypothetical protein D1007_27037 [Hordeum vulgare]